MIVDSHNHLHLIDYKKINSSIDDVIKNARSNNVRKQLCVSTHINQHQNILSICNEYHDIYGSIGVHPNEDIEINQFKLDDILKNHKKNKIIAIGETGLDYFHDKANRKKQILLFEKHIEYSIKYQLPLIIHSRCAKLDTVQILNKFKNYNIKGVVHCFTEDLDMATRLIDLGFLISFSGIITFKNARHLKQVVRKVPSSSFLIETDSPYLSPEPNRGKVNQPAHIIYTLKKISTLTGRSLEDVSDKTTSNFNKLFLSS